MSNLTVFNFESSEVRVIDIDGQPWFVAKDISDILDYSETSKMLRHIEEEDRLAINPHESPELGGCFESNVSKIATVNESGLYSAIFSSTKPEAKRFKRWVTAEVLPSIRQTGGYINPAATESQLANLISQLITKVNSIEEQSNNTIKYLQEDITAKNNVITQLTAEKDELNTIFLTYPGLKDAIDYFKLNIDEADNGFSLKTYLASKKINLSHGQRVSVGQLINGWLKVAGNYNLTKYNNCIIYQNKHQQLLDLAICYTLGL